jgi:hypothetical protein
MRFTVQPRLMCGQCQETPLRRTLALTPVSKADRDPGSASASQTAILATSKATRGKSARLILYQRVPADYVVSSGFSM